jgi:large subunit ribosomal protein L24
MANIKKGDNVQVITGSDKGKQGLVLAVLTEANKVIVQGVNLKQSDRGVKQGGIETIEAAIHISNVQVIDPGTKKVTRLGSREDKVTKNGVTKTVRVRVAKKSGKDI